MEGLAMLVVMSGLAGSGKSTVAEAIGRRRAAPVISVDPVESAVIAAGIPRSFETGLAAYLVAATLAEAHLVAGLDVVIDAANYVEPARQIWRDLARRRNAILKVIVCLVSDPALYGQRLAHRNRGPAMGEPSTAFLDEQRAEWTDWAEPHIVLDATESAEGNIEIALTYLE
jgi:predicted kinase